MSSINKPGLFFDGTDLKFIYLDEDVKGKLSVRSEGGKQFKIPEKNIVAYLDPCSYENFTQKSSGLMTEMKKIAGEVEVVFLWEMVAEETKDFNLNELAEIYFGEVNALRIGALFLALSAKAVYFKRKGIEFAPRTAEQVEEQLLAEKKKADREETKQRLVLWLKEVVSAEKIEVVPDEFQPALNQLEMFLYTRKPNEFTKVLSQLIGEESLKLNIYQFLKACGKIDESADKFLILAGINEKFPVKVIEHSEKLICQSGDGRKDFTDLATFSIDDEKTMDIDDALSVEQKSDGTCRVYIHIADVSAYVQKGDILDEEAGQRVTSIYLPNKTVNMFPNLLSQGLASLVAGEKRAAMSFVVDFDKNFEITGSEVYLAEIFVNKKLSYKEADQILAEGGEFTKELTLLKDIADALKKKRQSEGAAIFNRPELKIEVVDNVPQVGIIDRLSASRHLVSEFMILANSTAALFCFRHDVPIIYRTQDKPDNLPKSNENDEYDPLLFEKMIKCMKKSRLSLHPASHGGLGVEFYTQLTSPIRRYTDLIMQRQIAAHLRGEGLAYEPEELMSVLWTAESITNEVKEVQRQAESYWLHVYIKNNYLESVRDATVTGKIPGAYIIELGEIFYKTKLMSSERLNIGDKIRVRIDKVKVDKGVIFMTVV